MKAVRNDVDFNLGDSDIDAYLRGNGGIYVDGNRVTTSLALKRSSFTAYREKREEIVNWITSEIREGVVSGFFPLPVPFTYNVIESGE